MAGVGGAMPAGPPSPVPPPAPFVALAAVSAGVAAFALAHSWAGGGREVAVALGASAATGALLACAAALWHVRAVFRRREALRAAGHEGALARHRDLAQLYADEIVLLLGPGGEILDANARAEAVYGLPRGELVGRSVREIRAPEVAADVLHHLAQVQQAGGMRYETRHRRRDGTTFPAEVTSRVFEVAGQPYWQTVIRDVTAQRTAEEKARTSERKFRAAFHAAKLSALLVDRDGRIIEHNPAAEELFGRGDLVGRKTPEMNHPDCAAHAALRIRALCDGEVDEYVEARRIVRPDGTEREAVVRASAVRDEQGRFEYAMGIFEDVTERRRLEAELERRDRMASLGALAAGVAHEVNNPLACVLANLRYLGEELGPRLEGDLREALAESQQAGERVRRIVQDLRTFGGAEEGERTSADLAEVLRSALAMTRHETRARARVVVDLAPGLPLAAGAPHRLVQVFVNLLANAAHAIPEGRPEENEIRISAALEARSLVVEVADTGAGIDLALQARIFDPFFTSKPVGAGTGLGLSVCHGIVRALGGRIEVRSAPGSGSAFRVRLPLAAPAAPRDAGAAA